MQTFGKLQVGNHFIMVNPEDLPVDAPVFTKVEEQKAVIFGHNETYSPEENQAVIRIHL